MKHERKYQDLSLAELYSGAELIINRCERDLFLGRMEIEEAYRELVCMNLSTKERDIIPLRTAI